MLLGVYSLIDNAIFSLDKPSQMAAAEIIKTPKEVLLSKPKSPAAVRSPEVQKESTHIAEASHQEMSVPGAVETATLRLRLDTETQGQRDISSPSTFSVVSCVVWILPGPADVESMVLEEAPKQASRPPADVQQAWDQEAQQQMWLFIIAVLVLDQLTLVWVKTLSTECI